MFLKFLEINIISDKEKIVNYLKNKGISKNSFYKKTGLSIGFLDSGQSLGVDKLRIIIDNYPDFNYLHLLGLDTGKTALEYARTENMDRAKNELKMESGIPLVDHASVSPSHDSPFTIKENTIKGQYGIPLFEDKQVDFMMEIKDTAMYPTLKSGDLVACKIIKDPKFIQWNRIHIVVTKGQGIIIKRLQPGLEGHFKMLSDNKDFHSFDVPKVEITGIALIVGSVQLE